MTLPSLAKRGLAIGLAAQIVLATQFSTVARAEMLSTDAAITKYSAQANRDFLLGELQKQEIRDELIGLGVDPAEAEARLAVLTDAEIASMARQMENDTAGGNGVVGALVTVFLILLVTDLLCLTRLFNFTRCVR